MGADTAVISRPNANAVHSLCKQAPALQEKGPHEPICLPAKDTDPTDSDPPACPQVEATFVAFDWERSCQYMFAAFEGPADGSAAALAVCESELQAQLAAGDVTCATGAPSDQLVFPRTVFFTDGRFQCWVETVSGCPTTYTQQTFPDFSGRTFLQSLCGCDSTSPI